MSLDHGSSDADRCSGDRTKRLRWSANPGRSCVPRRIRGDFPGLCIDVFLLLLIFDFLGILSFVHADATQSLSIIFNPYSPCVWLYYLSRLHKIRVIRVSKLGIKLYV